MASIQKIIDALPVGKKNAIKVSDFEQAIGNQPSGTNNDQTRREVQSAILAENIPIGSSPSSGYWLIDSDDEYQEIIDRFDSTIRKFQTKKDALIKGWQIRKESLESGNPWPK